MSKIQISCQASRREDLDADADPRRRRFRHWDLPVGMRRGRVGAGHGLWPDRLCRPHANHKSSKRRFGIWRRIKPSRACGENIQFLHTLDIERLGVFNSEVAVRSAAAEFSPSSFRATLFPWSYCCGTTPVASLLRKEFSATPVRLCTFERTAFKAILGKTPAQVAKLAEEAAAYMEKVYRRTTDIGRRTARGRLAQLILELMSRLARRNLGSASDFPFR